MTNSPARHVFGIREDIGVGEWREDHYTTRSYYTVTATHPETGRRFAYAGPLPTPTRNAAKLVIERIESYQARQGVAIDPATREHWVEMDPCYGSPEYERRQPEIAAYDDRIDRENEEYPSSYTRWLSSIGA